MPRFDGEVFRFGTAIMLSAYRKSPARALAEGRWKRGLKMKVACLYTAQAVLASIGDEKSVRSLPGHCRHLT
jgi:hypothetical protein